MARELRRDQLGTLERATTTYGDVVRLSPDRQDDGSASTW
jgi:hypothetical protein